MKLNKAKIIILTCLITAALAGLIILQVQFLKDSYEQKEQAFNRNVIFALNSTAKMLELKETANNIMDYAITSLRDKSGKLPLPHEIIYNKKRKGLPLHPVKGKTEMVVFSDDDSLHVQINTGAGNNKSGSYSYSYNTSSGKNGPHGRNKIVSSYSSYDVVDNLKKLDSLDKKQMISLVMDKMILADQIPIEKRITGSEIDSLLKINFKNYSISIDYNYGVITQLKDSTKIVLSTANEESLRKSEFRALLYPSDIYPVRNFLSVVFPSSRYFLYKQIFPQLILSALFVLIIIGGFIYTIRIIFLQKKVGGLIIDFINNMTHEFKTPISTIALASEAIIQPEIHNDKVKLKKYNDIIRDENMRMRQQVDKILEMAVLEQGDYELNLAAVDLHELINKAVGNISVRVEDRGGKLETNLSASSHRMKGDAVHLINIINNILDNAIKYSPDGVHIFIQTHNEGNGIILSFIDDGIGIEGDDMNRVFDKYFRVPRGNLHDIKGFGLGLSYVKLIVEGHNGDIKIKSKPGAGTTVDISFPVIKEVQ